MLTCALFWVSCALVKASVMLGQFLIVCVYKLQEIQDSVAKAKHSTEEVMKIRKEIVDFHGEMVLLENYSALNYTGIDFFFLSLSNLCSGVVYGFVSVVRA